MKNLGKELSFCHFYLRLSEADDIFFLHMICVFAFLQISFRMSSRKGRKEETNFFHTLFLNGKLHVAKKGFEWNVHYSNVANMPTSNKTRFGQTSFAEDNLLE